MKIYKVNLLMQISYVVFSILIIFSSVLIIFDIKASIILKMMVPLGFLLAIGGSWTIFRAKIGTDEEKIVLFNIIDIWSLFLGKKIQSKDSSLRWGEIGELYTTFVLFPETADVILKPKEGVNKKRIGFLVGVGGMPLELLKNILSHLSPDCKVYLYSYLKRKLEGKQTWFYVK